MVGRPPIARGQLAGLIRRARDRIDGQTGRPQLACAFCYGEGVLVGSAQRLGVGQRGEDGGLGRGGRLVEDVAQGVRGVRGGEPSAVVEGDALADAEGPGAGPGVGLPGLGEVGGEVAVRVDADEAVVEGAEVFVRGQRAGRIQRLGLGGGRPGDTEGAAAVGGALLDRSPFSPFVQRND